jgi:hypothetical protein
LPIADVCWQIDRGHLQQLNPQTLAPISWRWDPEHSHKLYSPAKLLD